jgi:hypothetical protein
VRLSKYFGTTIQYWVDLQNAYDLAELENDTELNEALKKIQKAKKPAPVKKAADAGNGKKAAVKKDAPKKVAAPKAAPKKAAAKEKKPLLKKE